MPTTKWEWMMTTQVQESAETTGEEPLQPNREERGRAWGYMMPMPGVRYYVFLKGTPRTRRDLRVPSRQRSRLVGLLHPVSRIQIPPRGGIRAGDWVV